MADEPEVHCIVHYMVHCMVHYIALRGGVLRDSQVALMSTYIPRLLRIDIHMHGHRTQGAPCVRSTL